MVLLNKFIGDCAHAINNFSYIHESVYLYLTNLLDLCHNVSMDEVEDIEPGIQKMALSADELYPNYKERSRFEGRLSEFIEVNNISKIIEYRKGVLSYFTESVIPTKKDSRPPLLLIFGNPAPDSIINKCFFAGEKGRDQHRFWTALANAGIFSFETACNDINVARTKALFNLEYKSRFRIGLAVFYSLPSPPSDKWNGVDGLRSIFGTRALEEIALYETKRVKSIIHEFIGDNPQGAVIAFQKDAFLGVKDYKSQERLVAEQGKQRVVEARCSCDDVRLFRMPPTRYMLASWYVNFLWQVVGRCFGE